jgi:argininosuccinate lyase
MKKLWGGRFSKKTNEIVESFTESISFDCRLYEEDIDGSIAHAKMLAEQQIITSVEADKIIKGLQEIKKEIEKGEFEFRKEYEDIHMAIETRLKEKIGDIAGKLHTARSRNDQIALDMRLYVKKKIETIHLLITNLQKVFVEKAEKYKDCPAPGYTHLQRAQPVFLAHYLLAFVEMWERDKGRLIDCFKRVDFSPLGSCALAGTTFPLNREEVAKNLGFSGVTQNSMDAVSDRDFIIEFLSSLSIIMMHLSRLAEDMILWNSYEFSFVILPDDFCTGSSIMPQKKNPDVLELVRGKTGRVYGSLMAILTIMKGLPMTYNRDMQEDKEQLFDAVDTVEKCIEVLVPLFQKTEFNVAKLTEESKKGFILATEIADYLTKRGVPFRKAHEITGKIVAYCEKLKKDLFDLSLLEYKKFYPDFDSDLYEVIELKRAIGAKNVTGGTGEKSIKVQLKKWRKKLFQ